MMLSEFTDFAKPIDENSYEACLRTIDTCDYFILLIGSRVGGLYDRAQKLSITRMEYRRAYESLQNGKMKIITFVRKDVWIVREDRKALEKVLKAEHKEALELTDAQIDAIANHKSTFVSDAEATFSFIEEVARVSDMKEAMKTGVNFPRGNWIHPFETFEDVAVTIRQALGVSNNLRRRGLEIVLQQEIITNIRKFVHKRGNTLATDPLGALTLWDDLPRFDDFMATSPISAETVNTLVLGMKIYYPQRLETTFLDEALRSGEFLEYDREVHDFRVGPIQQGLLKVRDSIDRFHRTLTSEQNEKIFAKYLTQGDGAQVITIQNVDLIQIYMFYDAYEATTYSLINAYGALTGRSPLPSRDSHRDIATKFNVKTVAMPTVEEVDDWVKSFWT